MATSTYDTRKQEFQYVALSTLWLILCFIIVFSTKVETSAQQPNKTSVVVLNLLDAKYPIISAEFYLMDSVGRRLITPTKEWQIKENDLRASVLSVDCDVLGSAPKLSAVLTLDVSGSMEGKRLELMKQAARTFIRSMNLSVSECAITSFDDKNYLLQDFTQDGQKLFDALYALEADGGTDYNKALLDGMYSGLTMLSKARFKPVLLFVTDGLADKTRTEEILQKAKELNAVIYAVTIGMPAPQDVRRLAEKTDGLYFENITTEDQINNLFRVIANKEQRVTPCELLYQSICDTATTRTVEIIHTPTGARATAVYRVDPRLVKKVEFSSPSLVFGATAPNRSAVKEVRARAVQGDMNIVRATTSDARFVIEPMPQIIPADQEAMLRVRYTAKDSGYAYALCTVQTQCGSFSFYATATGYYAEHGTYKSLLITSPNEPVSTCEGTMITWEGVSPKDAIELSYSSNSGQTWMTITQQAQGLKYFWKNIPIVDSARVLLRARLLARGVDGVIAIANSSADTIVIQEYISGSPILLDKPRIKWLKIPTLSAGFGRQRDVVVPIAVNTGKVPVQIQSMSMKSPYFRIVSPTSMTILPGDTAFTEIRFSPLQEGRYNAILEIESSCQEKQSLAVDGYGGQVKMRVDSPLDFGKVAVTTKKDSVLTIKNVGDVPLVVRSIRQLGQYAHDFPMQIPALPMEIEAGQERSIPVRFQPTLYGNAKDSIEILTNIRKDLRGVVLRGEGIEPQGQWGLGLQLGGGYTVTEAPSWPLHVVVRPYATYDIVDWATGEVGVSFFNASGVSSTALPGQDFSTSIIASDLRVRLHPFVFNDVKPFVFGGVGLTAFSITQAPTTRSLPRTPETSGTAITYVVGAGMQCRLLPTLSLDFSVGWNNSQTDALNGLADGQPDGTYLALFGVRWLFGGR